MSDEDRQHELWVLNRRIQILEAENADLRAENERLRQECHHVDTIARVEAECAGSLDGDTVWVSDIRAAIAGTGEQE